MPVGLPGIGMWDMDDAMRELCTCQSTVEKPLFLPSILICNRWWARSWSTTLVLTSTSFFNLCTLSIGGLRMERAFL